MNVRLLGVLVMVIGVGLALYATQQRDMAKMSIASMELTDFYRAAAGTSGQGHRGASVPDMEKEREDAEEQMTIGWVLGAIGFAVAVAAKAPAKTGQVKGAQDDA